jgi:tRNA(Ile)-lysidine synthase
MIAPGQRVGVAVSGGPDSLCLLHVLCALRDAGGFAVQVVHVNHQLRGAESDADEQFVRDWADRLGLPCHVRRAELASGENVEQAGRDARRAFFGQLMRDGVVDRVATGHTRSDQAETVLFRLLRGAHTAGLAGILPVTREGIVRPLLDISRGDVEAYLAEHGHHARADSSNADPRFARNRLRHQWLPELRAAWNPELDARLAQVAELSREEEAYWRAEIERLYGDVARVDGEAVLFHTSVLAAQPRAMQRRLLRRAIETVRGDLRQIDFAHVEHVLRLLETAEGHGRAIIPGVDALRSFDWLRLAPRQLATIEERNVAHPVTVPGQAPLPAGDGCLELAFLEPGQKPHDTVKAVLDAGRLSPFASAGLELRSWKPGDHYQPHGRATSQKIKLLFQEFRIPLWERGLWPILTAGGVVVWSGAFGAAEGWQARPGERGVALAVRCGEPAQKGRRTRESIYPILTS